MQENARKFASASPGGGDFSFSLLLPVKFNLSDRGTFQRDVDLVRLLIPNGMQLVFQSVRAQPEIKHFAPNLDFDGCRALYAFMLFVVNCFKGDIKPGLFVRCCH